MNKYYTIVMLLLCIRLNAQIGNTLADGIATTQDAIDAVDLVLVANDLLYNVTLVYTKYDQVTKQYETINNFLANPKTRRYISDSQHQELLLEIQMTSQKIKMYGSALSYMLKAIKRNMEKHAVAMSAKTALSVLAAEQAVEEVVSNKIEAMIGKTDLKSTQTSISLFSSDAELRSHMEQAAKYIEGLLPKVMKINSELSIVSNDLTRLTVALNTSVGAQALFLMSVAPRYTEKK